MVTMMMCRQGQNSLISTTMVSVTIIVVYVCARVKQSTLSVSTQKSPALGIYNCRCLNKRLPIAVMILKVV